MPGEERRPFPTSPFTFWQAEVRWLLHLCFTYTWSYTCGLFPGALVTHNEIPAQKHDLPMTAEFSGQCLVCGVGEPQFALVFSLASQWYLTVSQQPCSCQAFGQDPSSCPTWATQAQYISGEDEVSCPPSNWGLCTCCTFCLGYSVQPL